MRSHARAQRLPSWPDGAISRAVDPRPAEIEWRVSDAPVAYEDALAFMEQRAAAIRAGTAPECVWLLEHPPLFTAGTSADPAELFNPLGLPVFDAGRGGRYTYHGPGQRVGYVMLDLEKRGKDIRCFVHALEGWMIAALAELGVNAHRADGRIGIWVGEGADESENRRAGRPRKALGDAPRLRAERRSGPVAFRRHRALRDRRIWRHQPRRTRETNAAGAG